MSNSNDKQPLDPESLLVSGKAQAPSTTTPTVNKLDYDGIRLGERRFSDVKPREKNDSLGIPGINQPDVTTRNLSFKYSDKASTSTDEQNIDILLYCALRGERGNQPSPSICKVSRILRDDNEIFFTPQLVSIGPIHNQDDEDLIVFGWLKECYLNDLLSRYDSTPKKKKTLLKACLLKVDTCKIRASYASCVIENYIYDKLARMMVMDGCFILEFCFKHEEGREYLPNKMEALRIAMDLMLLENQVPFSVLQALFECCMGDVPFTLSDVLDRYFAPYGMLFRPLLSEKNSTTDVDSSDSTYDHVLGYLHKRYQLVAAKASKRHQERIENTAFHSIVELDRSGVNFKPHQEDEWSMKIEFQSSLFACLPCFWSKPTLLMPTLVIDDRTELILRNFIAYEQSFPQDRYYFTSYAHAMDMLIDSQDDIAKLVKSKVLVNYLGSNQEAADMINKVCKNISITDFYYTEEFKKMDEYHNRFWPKNMAWLRKVYFNNPWNFLALLGALILFGLTVTQTIYTIRAA